MMEKLVESIRFLIEWMMIQDRGFDQQDQVITVGQNSQILKAPAITLFFKYIFNAKRARSIA